jgi:hypothetical protein
MPPESCLKLYNIFQTLSSIPRNSEIIELCDNSIQEPGKNLNIPAKRLIIMNPQKGGLLKIIIQELTTRSSANKKLCLRSSFINSQEAPLPKIMIHEPTRKLW